METEENAKEWQRVADGIWRRSTGTLYERPKIGGRFTFRSLGTGSLKLAKEELHNRRADPAKAYSRTTRTLTTTGEVTGPVGIRLSLRRWFDKASLGRTNGVKVGERIEDFQDRHQ
jgi:hypothetical protein